MFLVLFLGFCFFGVWAFGSLHSDRDSPFVGAFAPEDDDDHTSFRTARP